MSLGEIKSIRVRSASGFPTQYIWEISGSIDWISGTADRVTIEAARLGLGDFKVKTKNECGYSMNGGDTVNVTSGGGGRMFKAYPNPAKNILTIEIDANKIPKNIQNKAIKIRIMDKMKVVNKQISFSGNQTTINVSDLKTGIYILQVIVDNEISEQKIIISNQ